MKKSKLYRFRSGLTLVEVMLAAAVIIVAALGTLCYEYLCVDHVRYARAQMTATRIGQLLIEDWKSTGGDVDYNPEDLNMGFTLLSQDNFRTTIDGLPLYISKSQSEVTPGDVNLIHLNVEVQWRHDFSADAVTDDDPKVSLDTYVRKDQ